MNRNAQEKKIIGWPVIEKESERGQWEQIKANNGQKVTSRRFKCEDK